MTNTDETPSSSERTNAAMIHLLSALVAPFITPLVGYYVLQSKGGFAYRQAREGLNFQISVIIYSTILAVSIVGLLVLPFVLIAAWVLLVIATFKVYQGEEFRFPLTLRFIKI